MPASNALSSLCLYDSQPNDVNVDKYFSLNMPAVTLFNAR